MDTSTKDRLTIQVDHERKIAAQEIANNLGTDLPNLLNIFIARVVKEKGLPFQLVENPRDEELELALKQARAGETNRYSFSEFDQYLKDLEAKENA